MPTHIVADGECLTELADRYGFFWEQLWDHPENAELRALRGNPNVLLPGDSVFIPDIEPKAVSCATKARHVFRLKGIPAKLVFQLLDESGAPRAGLPYTLEVTGAEDQAGTTGADGMISHVIPPTAPSAKLVVHDPEGDEEYDFDLGKLNPVEDPRGVQARLMNLGFYEGPLSASYDDETRDAIRAFQVAQGLPENGEADDATRDALRTAHGS